MLELVQSQLVLVEHAIDSPSTSLSSSTSIWRSYFSTPFSNGFITDSTLPHLLSLDFADGKHQQIIMLSRSSSTWTFVASVNGFTLLLQFSSILK